jgi:hypothetical protein
MDTIDEKIDYILTHSPFGREQVLLFGQQHARQKLAMGGQVFINDQYENLMHEVVMGESYMVNTPDATLRPDFEEWMEQQKQEALNPPKPDNEN